MLHSLRPQSCHPSTRSASVANVCLPRTDPAPSGSTAGRGSNSYGRHPGSHRGPPKPQSPRAFQLNHCPFEKARAENNFEQSRAQHTAVFSERRLGRPGYSAQCRTRAMGVVLDHRRNVRQHTFCHLLSARERAPSGNRTSAARRTASAMLKPTRQSAPAGLAPTECKGKRRRHEPSSSVRNAPQIHLSDIPPSPSCTPAGAHLLPEQTGSLKSFTLALCFHKTLPRIPPPTRKQVTRDARVQQT